jgi:trk system potassium uptake protein TrkH
METKALLRALAALLGVVAGFMAASMIAGLLMGEGYSALIAFGPPVLFGIFILVWAALVRPGSGKPYLSPRTGYLFVVLGWVFSAGLGALPFVLSGSIPSVIDAFFESMSGFTTTGASILTDIESLPRSILLWRATTHWLGGMGIVVLTVAVFPLLGIGGRALMEAEAPGPQVDKFTPRLSQTAKILWLIYFGLTVALAILLMIGGMDLFDAVTHAFATMATGGFSTRNASIGAFKSPYIHVVITVFMFLAGMNFALHWRILRGELLQAFRDTEFRFFTGIFLVASVLMAQDLLRNGSYESGSAALRHASFQAASILTTTGFATADYLVWPPLSQGVLFILMFVGGCAGSTGGGVKVGRILTLIKMGFSEMRYLINPNGIYGIYVNRVPLRKNIVYDIAAMVFLYLIALFVSVLVLTASGLDILTSLTATLASLGNIGPGFGRVGPALNYAFLPDAIKAWLSFIMLLGRLEVYTVLVIFTRAFWRH